jgi:hypothetical protein
MAELCIAYLNFKGVADEALLAHWREALAPLDSEYLYWEVHDRGPLRA